MLHYRNGSVSAPPLRYPNLVQPLQRTQAQRQSLRSAADTHKSCNRPVFSFLLNAQVGECILTWTQLAWPASNEPPRLTKHASGVQVGRQELAVALHRCLGRQTAHVGTRHQLLQELAQCLGLRVDVDLVFPFKLGPHCPELCLCALCRLDVVHDVDVHIIEDDHIRVDALLAVGSVSRRYRKGQPRQHTLRTRRYRK